MVASSEPPPREDGSLHGLISGYRHLLVFPELAGEDPAFTAIPALIREGLNAAAHAMLGARDRHENVAAAA